MLLCDTGVLLAAGNVKDQAHQACLKLLRQAEGSLLVPSPVLGEIGYLLQSRVGPQAEVTFLKSFGGDGFHIAELEHQDIRRMAGLVETYIDLPLGIVDAAVIAIAERLRLTEIATLDHRHFQCRAANSRPGVHPPPRLTDSLTTEARIPKRARDVITTHHVNGRFRMLKMT
jgi:predicted nucleic acid-binding protein